MISQETLRWSEEFCDKSVRLKTVNYCYRALNFRYLRVSWVKPLQSVSSYCIYCQNHIPEAVAWRCSVKNVFLKISQNSQGSACVEVSFLIFIKKETPTLMFSCEFCEILRTPFLQNTFRWLLLSIYFF